MNNNLDSLCCRIKIQWEMIFHPNNNENNNQLLQSKEYVLRGFTADNK